MRAAIGDNWGAAPSVGEGRRPESQVASRSIRFAWGRANSRALRRRLVALALSMLPLSAYAQFAQQGPKLVGTGALGPAQQGCSVALSADGNTAIVGGCLDNAGGTPFGDGAAWVWTRSAGVWTQQAKLADPDDVGLGWGQGFSVALSADGNMALVGAENGAPVGSTDVWVRSGIIWTIQARLVGTGAVGDAYQGSASALSADGNTALVGGFYDDNGAGAAWVFTRSGGVWSQQGAKLVGTGASGNADQGSSVAISADGNTAIVGAPYDSNNAGAVWVYTRSGGVWSQQGDKLVGTAAAGGARQGGSAAISADGNTAIVGGEEDNSSLGAVWVYTRSGGVWTQQGSKLVGTGAVGAALQGRSVGISADGNTAIVGGLRDNSDVGAAWVWTRSGGVWTQQGSKLVRPGARGTTWQGWSAAISADGNTAIVGGEEDNSSLGAAWVYTRGVGLWTQVVAVGQQAGR